MDNIVHLGESSQCPSTQVPIDVDCSFPFEFVEDQVPLSFAPVPSRGAGVPGVGRVLDARRPFPLTQRLRFPTRLGVPTGRRQKCLSSSVNNELSGMGGTVATNLPWQSLFMEPLHGN